MSDSQTALRAWRRDRRIGLDDLRDLFLERGLKNPPSIATLSRIERGQPVPPSLIAIFVSVTGIPARELRPDLAKLFDEVGP